MRNLRTIISYWDRFESFIGGIFLTVASMIIVVEVILRSFLGKSIMGSDELACFAIIWSVFFTASIGVKRDIHVRIDLFLHFLSPQIRRWTLAFGMVFVTLFSAYLAYSGFLLVHEAFIVGDYTVGLVRVPLWLPQFIMPLGGFLLFVRSLAETVRLIRLREGHFEGVVEVREAL